MSVTGTNGHSDLTIPENDESYDEITEINTSMKIPRHRKTGLVRPTPNLLTVKAESLEELPLPTKEEADPPPLLVSPPDGGYGWIIVFASFMNHVIGDGISFTFGVYLPNFLEYFEAGSAKTALIGSLMNAFYLLSAPFAGLLITRFGCRSVAMAGAILAALGFSLSVLSPNIETMMFTYGIMGGVGLGVLYLPNIVAVSYYFERRRARATGIAVCGAGVGCFAFAPLVGWLLREFSWKNSMLITAGIALNGAVFGALLRPVEVIRQPKPKQPIGRKKSVIERFREKIQTPSSAEIQLAREQKRMDKAMDIRLAREGLSADGLSSYTNQNSLMRQRNSRSVPAVTQESILNVVRAGNVPGKYPSEVCVGPTRTRFGGYITPMRRRDMALGSSFMLTPAHSYSSLHRSTAKLSVVSMTSTSDVQVLEGSVPMELDSAGKTIKERFKEEYVALLTDSRFVVPCLGNMLSAIGLFIPFVYLVDRAADPELGLSRTQASFLLSVIGITNTFGRLAAGMLADFESINTLAMHNCALILAGVSSMLVVFCRTYITLCIYAAFFGLCVATFISLTSIVLCDLLGLERLTTAFSILTMTRGISTLIGSPMAGSLFDYTQDYNAMFLLSGATMLCGGLLMCLLHLPYFKSDNTEEIFKEASQLDELPIPRKLGMLPEVHEPESPVNFETLKA